MATPHEALLLEADERHVHGRHGDLSACHLRQLVPDGRPVGPGSEPRHRQRRQLLKLTDAGGVERREEASLELFAFSNIGFHHSPAITNTSPSHASVGHDGACMLALNREVVHGREET